MRDDEELLDHPRRQKIFDTVKEAPGINWSQLHRRTGLSVGALMFHLKRLESEDVVVRKPSTNDNEVLFFTQEDEDLWRDPRTRVLFGNESTRRIAEIVANGEGLSAKDVAEELDVTPAAVRYHLSKLEDKNLVDRERDGRYVRYEADRDLTSWINRLG
jgi:predicted transcriptional regulator